MPDVLIKRIHAEETYPVRHPVLRKNRPLDSCRFDGDDLNTTFHLGLYMDDELAGVATFLQQKHPQFSEELQFQLRGMAVLETYQGTSLGTQLLKQGEKELIEMQVNRLWFNARVGAISFYKKHGYRKIGDEFEIANVGPHYIMTKLL